MNLLRLLYLTLALPVLLLGTESPPVTKGAVTALLYTDARAITPGQTFTVALRLEHQPHWHSYWLNPGTGYPTSLTWTLPDGFQAGPIQWPTPHVMRDSANTIIGNGYENTVDLLVDITAPSTLTADTTITLAAVADWLMCETVCVPGNANLTLALPVATSSTTDSKWTTALASARDQLPKSLTSWTISATREEKNITLRLDASTAHPSQIEKPHFFSSDGYVDYAANQIVRQENSTWFITLPIDSAADKNTRRLTGVLASANGWSISSQYGGLVIDAPLPSTTGRSAINTATSQLSGSGFSTLDSRPQAAPSGLAATLLLAFVGGMILNLMPCVFPVLGIKILGFVNQSGNDRKKITLHGLVFALGVLLSFWTLAVVLLVLRSGGAQLGWGFQLQSPAFVFGMTVFMLIFALNMSGLFEVGLAATGVGGNLQMKPGYGGSFFTGALATLVATPCSAPFLAPALGAALALSAGQSILVFTAIAIGLALPYLLLSLFPQAIKFLPRPGAWMETFKQFMAFPLYATVGWLLWVLAGQTKEDDQALLMIAFGLVLVAMAAWAYGRFGQAHGKPARQRLGYLVAALLFAGGLYTGWPKSADPAHAASGYQLTWEKWSPEAIASAQAAGKFVYVDFTARWCATCQTNKAAVFHNQALLAEFARRGVVLLRADWTNRDPKITTELARWNRSAVPFNLIYAPSKPEPVILPELLTPGKVLEALAKISAQP